MRRGLACLGAAGVLFALLGQIEDVPPTLAAGLTVSSTVVLALLMRGGVSLAAEAAELGAGGAAVYEAATPYLPILASGLLLTFVFGTRAVRSRSWRELLFHLGVAFGAGTAASWVSRTHTPGEVALWLLAVTLASVLASAAWLLPRDGPRVFVLRRLAARAQGPLRWRLLRAAAVAKQLGELDTPLARPLRRRVGAAFDEVVARAEGKLAVGLGHVADEQLTRTVDELTRIRREHRRERSAFSTGIAHAPSAALRRDL